MSKWSSQATTSWVTLTKSSRSSSYFLSWQSIIRCCIDCLVAPQSHSGLPLNFHLCIRSLHLPCPVRILLSLIQVFLGRSMAKTGVRTLSYWIPPGLSCCHILIYLIYNTCPFDSVSGIIAMAYTDVLCYKEFIDLNKSNMLLFCKALGLHGPNNQIYTDGFEILRLFIRESNILFNTKIIDTRCNITYIITKLLEPNLTIGNRNY